MYPTRGANRRRTGFTLVETLVAISVLTFAVVGPLYTASRALVVTETARDRLTASYLAQEGVEYVRAMRDDAYLHAYVNGGTNPDVSTAAWQDFIGGSSSWSITACEPTTCTLDPARAMGSGSGYALLPCASGTCTPLYVANNIYTQQSGITGAVETRFTRTIQVIMVSASDARVVSTVTWTSHGTPYSIDVVEHLTSWQ